MNNATFSTSPKNRKKGAATSSTSGSSAFGASTSSFGGFQSPPKQTVGPGFGSPGQSASPFRSLTPAFGSPTTQESTAPTFGSPAGGSFSFGEAATRATTTSTGFGFTTPISGFSSISPGSAKKSKPPQSTQSSFAFSPGTSTTAFGQTAKPAFGFGSTSTTSAAAPTFGTPTASPFLLGQTLPTKVGLSFGTPTQEPIFGQVKHTFGTSFGTTQLQRPIARSGTPSVSSPQTGLNLCGTQQLNLSTSQLCAGLNLAVSQPTTGLGLTSQASGGLSFGTSPAGALGTQSGLTLGTSTSQAVTTSAELGFGKAKLNFGTPAMASSTAATTQPSFSGTPAAGLGFGTAVSSAAPMPGFGLCTPTTSTPAPATTTTTASTGVSLSTPAASTAATSAALSFGTVASTTNSGWLAALSLKTTPASTAVTSSAAPTTAPSSIAPLKPATATTALATTTTTTAQSQPFAEVSFVQLEENINKWTLELEEQEKTFLNQATQINAWDRLLIANGEKIGELNEAVETVKNEQQSLEHELDFVLAQQRELDELLAPIEKQLQEDSGDRMRDPEREQMYSLAENLDTQLRQMSGDLKEVIEHLNETKRNQDSNDPIVQVGRILNAHMSSMQWIDNSITQISTKIEQLSVTYDTLRKDNERYFPSTYN